MSYTVLANSQTPALIIYLLDTSGSMSEACGEVRRVDAVMAALNRQMIKMVQRSTKGAMVQPRYRIAMFSYSSTVTDLLDGVKTITELAQLGTPDLVPGEHTGTAAAFGAAEQLLLAELPGMQHCPAPLVCHMTDGGWNDGQDPSPIAARIKQLGTEDGNVLIENIFVNDAALPTPIDNIRTWHGLQSRDQLATEETRLMYDMSSPLPPTYREVILEYGYNLDANVRLMLPGNTPEMVELGFTVSSVTPTQPVRVG